MCGTIETLDEKGAKSVWINGILQIVIGGVSIIFQAAAVALANNALRSYAPYILIGSGIWAGIFFVIAGIITLLAGVRRNIFGLIVAALTFQILNAIFALTHFFYVVLALAAGRFYWHCYSWWWGGMSRMPPDCADWQYPVLVVVHVVLMVTAFAELISIVWSLILLSGAVHKRRLLGRSKPDDVDPRPPTVRHVNFHATTGSVKANAVVQLTVTIVSMIVGVVILFVVAYGVGSGKGDRRPNMLQNSGSTLWCGVFFVLTAALGLKAARFGQNVHLILFLCLSVLGLILAPLEIFGTSMTIADKDYGMLIKNRECDPDNDCHYVLAHNSDQFVVPLIVLNVFIILLALAQFAFSIWGIVSASIALHRDGVCARCCSEANCFCEDCCGSATCNGAGGPESVPGAVQYVVAQGSAPGTLVLVPQNVAGSLDPRTVQIAVANAIPPPAVEIPT